MLIVNTINDALVELGVLNPTDEASPQDHEYGLRTLNRIVDLYNTQNLLITYIQDIAIEAPYTTNECESADPEDFTVRQWKSSITIGHCQDINREAPVDIQGLFWRQDETDFISKPMSMNEYAQIPTKETSSIPKFHYIQKIDNNNIRIYFDTVPLEGLELHLQAKQPYTGKNSVGNEYIPTDDINWTFGFEKMLMKRLAIELAPSYEVQPSQILVASAAEAENYVKAFNYQPRTLKADIGLLGGRTRGNRTNRARY